MTGVCGKIQSVIMRQSRKNGHEWQNIIAQAMETWRKSWEVRKTFASIFSLVFFYQVHFASATNVGMGLVT